DIIVRSLKLFETVTGFQLRPPELAARCRDDPAGGDRYVSPEGDLACITNRPLLGDRLLPGVGDLGDAGLYGTSVLLRRSLEAGVRRLGRGQRSETAVNHRCAGPERSLVAADSATSFVGNSVDDGNRDYRDRSASGAAYPVVAPLVGHVFGGDAPGN